jgi:hypothetical protein
MHANPVASMKGCSPASETSSMELCSWSPVQTLLVIFLCGSASNLAYCLVSVHSMLDSQLLFSLW